MDSLKVCFIGVGSIAKRHIKNLCTICDREKIKLQTDVIRRTPVLGNEPVFDRIDHVYSSFLEITDSYDAVFITNPTKCHIDTLINAAPFGKNFFIEKPVASMNQLEAAADFKQKPGVVYYVACPLRYNAVIQYIKDNVKPEDVFSVRAISSSYLPDWRPGQDYRDTYSAHRDLGGGVSIDLIHEWDYLTYLFGKPLSVEYMGGKISDLEIDSDDYALYMAKYPDKTLELHLDYFGRKTIREVTLYTKDDTIVGDIAGNKIHFLKSGKTIEFNEERDDYQIRDLEYFLGLIGNKEDESCGIQHAIDVLRLTQGEL